jgi:N-acetylglucosaminyl-diphospho-decaprenol L-rhamnosyltransferase
VNSAPLLSVVLVSYNTKELLCKCLNSLLANFKSSRPEIIVVDNCSQDGSVEMVKIDFPDVTLMRNESNVGFARATNQGIRASHGKYILLLNPDTLIVGNAIDEILDWMESHQEVGICGPQLLNGDGTIQRSVFSFPSLLTVTFVHLLPFLTPINRLLRIEEFRDHKTSQVVQCVSGACFMIRRDVINSVGLLDERFFLNAEEMDFCFRTKLDGWKVYYLAEAKVVHYGGKSSESNPTFGFIEFHRAQHLYYAKYFGRLKQMMLKIILFLGVLVRVAYYRLRMPLGDQVGKETAGGKWMLFQKTLRWYLFPEQ